MMLFVLFGLRFVPGIGYFTLPYLVYTGVKHLHACEWNPNAVEALRRNVELNGVADRCTVHAGDNREVIASLCLSFYFMLTCPCYLDPQTLEHYFYMGIHNCFILHKIQCGYFFFKAVLNSYSTHVLCFEHKIR